MKNFLKNYWPWIVTWFLLLILIGCNVWLVKCELNRLKLYKNSFFNIKASGSSNDPPFLGGGGKPSWQSSNESISEKQEKNRQHLIKIIEKEKSLNEGEWFHCKTTFSTKEEFIKHWKECPRIPVFLEKYWGANYNETVCNKCSLVEEIILNGQTIYRHKCSG